MKQTFIYLLSVITLYIIAFSVAHLISIIMESARIKKEKNIIKSEIIIHESNEKDMHEIDSILQEMKQQQIRYEHNCFYVSIILTLLFIVLVVIAFITNGVSFNTKYLNYIYIGLPILCFHTIDRGFGYFKEKYLTKNNEYQNQK